MKNRSFFLLCLLLVVCIVSQAQVKDDDDDDDDAPAKPSVMKPTDQPAGAHFDCPYEKDFQRSKKVEGYVLQLVPGPKDGARCRAVLTSPKGRLTTVAEEWALSVDKVSGADINAGGKPEIVLDGYTGGAQCCYTYTIVTLGVSPKVLRRFSNKIAVDFQKDAGGGLVMRTQDGVFDFFLLPHRAAVIPALVLKLDGNKFLDVSAQFPQQYDEEISRARSELSTQDLEKFRQSNYHERMFTDQVATVHWVLTIVLDYLYSGREEKAWQTLNELWPPSDQARVKSLIIERRERGLLHDLNGIPKE